MQLVPQAKLLNKRKNRPHSEVAESSFGDEFDSIRKQLDQMCTDIHQTRDDLKSLMSKEEMKAFIASIVDKIAHEMTTQLEAKFTEKVETEVV